MASEITALARESVATAIYLSSRVAQESQRPLLCGGGFPPSRRLALWAGANGRPVWLMEGVSITSNSHQGRAELCSGEQTSIPLFAESGENGAVWKLQWEMWWRQVAGLISCVIWLPMQSALQEKAPNKLVTQIYFASILSLGRRGKHRVAV